MKFEELKNSIPVYTETEEGQKYFIAKCPVKSCDHDEEAHVIGDDNLAKVRVLSNMLAHLEREHDIKPDPEE